MKNSKPASSQGESNNKPVLKPQQSRQDIFKQQQYLGWQVLDTESRIYSQTQVNMQTIMYLTSLYMKIIERLNSMQDSRQPYFTLKMQKLMSEPYIIRCFNNSYDHKSSTLENRRKELEQRIEKETERQNHKTVLEQALLAQEEKEKKMMRKIKDHFDQSDKDLDERIKKRNILREYRSSVQSPRKGTSEASELNSSNHLSAQSKSRSCISIQNEFNMSFDEESESKKQLQGQPQEKKQAANIFKGWSTKEERQR